MRRIATIALFIAMTILLPAAAFGVTQKEEIDLGRKAMLQLRPQGLVHETPFNQVGSALKEKVARKDLPWEFWVIEDPKQLNAFALPGGFVFITRAYYERLDTDELAFVVGHEMTHIDKKHFEQQLKRAKQAQLFNILASVVVGATKAGRGWGTAADLGTTAYFTKYSRKMEKEADLGGYALTKAAGFDAHGGVTALEKLGKDKSDPITANIFATHPLLSSREDRLSDIGKNEPAPAPRRDIQKVGHPNWKPNHPTKDDLKKRPGLAVRVVETGGERWENNWRADFRSIVSSQIELAGKYAVRGEDRSDSREEPKLSDLLERDHADKLLLITIHQISSEPVGGADKGTQDYQTIVDYSAKIIDTSSGEEKTLDDIKLVRQEAATFPVDKGKLFADMTLTQLIKSAAKKTAAKIGAA